MAGNNHAAIDLEAGGGHPVRPKTPFPMWVKVGVGATAAATIMYGMAMMTSTMVLRDIKSLDQSPVNSCSRGSQSSRSRGKSGSSRTRRKSKSGTRGKSVRSPVPAGSSRSDKRTREGKLIRDATVEYTDKDQNRNIFGTGTAVLMLNPGGNSMRKDYRGNTICYYIGNDYRKKDGTTVALHNVVRISGLWKGWPVFLYKIEFIYRPVTRLDRKDVLTRGMCKKNKLIPLSKSLYNKLVRKHLAGHYDDRTFRSENKEDLRL